MFKSGHLNHNYHNQKLPLVMESWLPVTHIQVEADHSLPRSHTCVCTTLAPASVCYCLAHCCDERLNKQLRKEFIPAHDLSVQSTVERWVAGPREGIRGSSFSPAPAHVMMPYTLGLNFPSLVNLTKAPLRHAPRLVSGANLDAININHQDTQV